MANAINAMYMISNASVFSRRDERSSWNLLFFFLSE